MISDFDASFAAMIVFRPLRVDNEQNDLAVAEVMTDLVDRRLKEVRTVCPSSTVFSVMSSPAALYIEVDDVASGIIGIAMSGLIVASLSARRAFRPPLLARE